MYVYQCTDNNEQHSCLQLLDTKTQDRKQTLLNYITHIVETLYPNVLSFYEDLSIDEACEGQEGESPCTAMYLI